jgi:hypothetical protein
MIIGCRTELLQHRCHSGASIPMSPGSAASHLVRQEG